MSRKNNLKETFSADFGNGLQCTMVFEKRPKAKTVSIMPIEWSRPMSGKAELASIAGAYRTWTNTVRAAMATKWGVKMMCALNVEKDRTEIWIYEPNKAPVLDRVLKCNIP